MLLREPSLFCNPAGPSCASVAVAAKFCRRARAPKPTLMERVRMRLVPARAERVRGRERTYRRRVKGARLGVKRRGQRGVSQRSGEGGGACKRARVRACVLAFVRACVRASMRACVRASCVCVCVACVREREMKRWVGDPSPPDPPPPPPLHLHVTHFKPVSSHVAYPVPRPTYVKTSLSQCRITPHPTPHPALHMAFYDMAP
jgi:hypothetical protein